MTVAAQGTAEPRRLKVLVVSNLFPTPVEPDRATYNRQQFAALASSADLRVAVPVYWHQWRRRDFPDTEFDGVPASYFPFFYPPRVLERLHGLGMVLSLRAAEGRRAHAARPDVILASWLHPDAYGAADLARDLRIPLVVKVHGSDANVLASVPARAAQIRQVLAHADAVVAVSAALRARLLELGARPQRTVVIYNGVDRERFRPGDRLAARARLHLDPAARYVLYVGNLKVSKGCEDLLHAIAEARGTFGPDVRFVFAGGGPDRDRLLALADSLGIESCVQFVGTQSHGSLPDWYRAADLVCLPSHNEGVPNVLLESMACGVPVVATRVGGVPEVVPPEAGLLVEPRQVAQLAEALLTALERPWQADAIAKYAARFDWSRSAGALHDVLQRAVAGEDAGETPRAGEAESPSSVTHRSAAAG
jgi:glycosyltransferase involved in cell wall biosynthesis